MKSERAISDQPPGAPGAARPEAPAKSAANRVPWAGFAKARRLFDWLSLRGAVDEARAKEVATAPRAAMVRMAHAYADVAGTAFASDNKVPVAPVLCLYREAIFLLLAKDLAGKKSLTIAFETAPQSVLAEGAPADARLMRLRHVLALHASLEAGEASTRERRDIVGITRACVRAMLDLADAGGLDEVLARRRWRVGFAAAALLVALGTLTGLGIHLATPRDLAEGQHWTASSALKPFPPSKALFHTIEEANPWFEIDLGRPKRVKGLYVKNRSDCCQERAVPLVGEVSLDRTNWDVVARRESPFQVWETSFPTIYARYVRLRVPRKSFLHLEEVKVF